MRFLADMGVSLRVVEWLRTRGEDVVHLRDQGLQRMPNGDIFTKAAAEGRVVLTFDLDFGEIVALSRGAKTSVVVFRLRDTRTEHVIARLDRVLDESSEALARGAIARLRRSPPAHEDHDVRPALALVLARDEELGEHKAGQTRPLDPDKL